MVPNKYKFYINSERVYPHYKQLKKKYSIESGQRFFRVNLEGTITLYGADYYVVKTSSIETDLIFKVISEDGLEYFSGTFNKSDCKFKDDKRAVEIKLTPNDKYDSLLDKYKNSYNLIDLKPETTSVTISKRPVLQIYCVGDNKIGNFMGGVYWETEVEAQYNILDLSENKYHFVLDYLQFEIVINNGSIYDGIYAGIENNIISYDNTNIYFTASGGVEIDPGTGEIINYNETITAKDKITGKELYRGITSGSDRRMNVTLNAIDSSVSGTLNITFTVFYFMSRYMLASAVNTGIGNGPIYGIEMRQDDFAGKDSTYKYVYPIKLNSEIALSSNQSSNPSKYGKNEFGKYFLPNKGNIHYFPIARSQWDYSSSWFSHSQLTETFDVNNITYYELKDGIEISQAIKVLLDKLDIGLKHEGTVEYSNFLYGQSNPITNDWFRIVITQKSNILKGVYDQAATKAPISLEDIFDMLRNCFRCYFFIDGNKLRIEHVKFFDNGMSYTSNEQLFFDLTSNEDTINNKLLSYGQNNLEYDKNNLSSRYEFEWMDNSTSIYSGYPIDVKAKYVQKGKVESISVNSFSSDLDMMQLSPNEFSSDGFSLLCCTYNSIGNFYNMPNKKIELVDEFGIKYGILTQNTYATWHYLQKFYMHDMPAFNIAYDNLPNNYLKVKNIKKCMLQDVKFPIKNSNINELYVYRLVKTDVGNGTINEMSIDIETNQVEATLSFIPS